MTFEFQKWTLSDKIPKNDEIIITSACENIAFFVDLDAIHATCVLSKHGIFLFYDFFFVSEIVYVDISVFEPGEDERLELSFLDF